MASPSDVLRVAANEIGYYAPSDPEPGSKYGRWMADKTGESWLAGPSTSIWWCMIFVSWCFDQAGVSWAALPSYNTDTTVSRVRNGKGGTILSNNKNAQPGDVVIFDWNMSTASTDHVGIVEKNYGNYIQTIEGNTSGSDWGSQSAGNGVHRRTRNWSVIRYIIRPPYAEGSSATPSNYSGNEHIDEDGYWGYATTTKAQKVAGTPVDHVVSSQNAAYKHLMPGVTGSWEWVNRPGGSLLIQNIQKACGVDPDGIFGPDSINGFIKRYGNGVCDSRLDAPSIAIKGFQRSLNEGHL